MRTTNMQLNNLHNTASLKELMTAKPMTAAEHERINQERVERRRRLEDAKDSIAIDRRYCGFYG